jgi:hypothetical protein
LDYQIYYDKKPSNKILSHVQINYENIWQFNQNLAIGFFLASVYDLKFDKIIIPKKLEGIKELFKTNPLSVLPLWGRSVAAKPFRFVSNNSKACALLRMIRKRLSVTKENEMTKKLEELGLTKNGGLTILGDIVLARIQQF